MRGDFLREYGVAEAELLLMPWWLFLDRIASLSAQSIFVPIWTQQRPPDYVSPDEVESIIDRM